VSPEHVQSVREQAESLMVASEVEAHQGILDRLCQFAVEGGTVEEQAEIAYTLGTTAATLGIMDEGAQTETAMFKAHRLLMALLTLADGEQRPERVSPQTVANCRNLVYPTIWDRLS